MDAGYFWTTWISSCVFQRAEEQAFYALDDCGRTARRFSCQIGGAAPTSRSQAVVTRRLVLWQPVRTAWDADRRVSGSGGRTLDGRAFAK